jgi:glycosyltransferase involved in cell wall biosynthesis
VERRSRLLYISGTPLLPSKIGPARRNHHIVEQLSRFYDVAVIAVDSSDDRGVVNAACARGLTDVALVAPGPRHVPKVIRKAWLTATGRCDFLPALEPALRSACGELGARPRFDAIVLSSMLLYSLPLPEHTPIVADTHNAEFDLHRRTVAFGDGFLRRWYAAWQGPLTRTEEQRCGRRARLVLATCERDRQLFRSELGISHAEVIPNGIDLGEFRPAAPSSLPIILFTGLLSYYPNQQGIRWFLDRVLPSVLEQVPHARVVVAGAAPPRWLLSRQSATVKVTGLVTDMRPYLRDAAVVVAPLRIGGGTRVKILEAQAMARPVVSTTIGAEGLHQHPGETLLIADDAETFARQLVRILTAPEEARAIALRGSRHVAQFFDWHRIGERLNRLLDERLGLAGRSDDHGAHGLPPPPRIPALRAS